MSDPLADLGHTLSVRVISATNLPANNKLTGDSDPYCKIFLVAGAKTLVGKTKTVKRTVNPEWNSAPQLFNAVRGFRVCFEVWDSEVLHSDALLAVGTFDPNVNEFGAKGHTELQLTRMKSQVKDKNAPTTLIVDVAWQPKPFIELIGECPLIKSIVYLTFDTDNPHRVRAPFSSRYPINVKGVLPYQFPFDLSLALFYKSSTDYEYVCSSHNSVPGACHSGRNLCGSFNSLVPCIRLDPELLVSAGFASLLVMVSTSD
jgi:hypothetical protein